MFISIYMINDYCPFSLWIEVVAAATTIVHGEWTLIVATVHFYATFRIYDNGLDTQYVIDLTTGSTCLLCDTDGATEVR